MSHLVVALFSPGLLVASTGWDADCRLTVSRTCPWMSWKGRCLSQGCRDFDIDSIPSKYRDSIADMIMFNWNVKINKWFLWFCPWLVDLFCGKTQGRDFRQITNHSYPYKKNCSIKIIIKIIIMNNFQFYHTHCLKVPFVKLGLIYKFFIGKSLTYWPQTQ